MTRDDGKYSKKLQEEALKGAMAETVQRYGSAVKQHYVAYSGIDNETGKKLAKGLKDISKSKINPEYRSQNIKQQAGFAAEVKSVARKNAENIIEGKGNRFVRTDDIGRVNDPLADLVELAPDGTVISGTASQMKFVGSSPEELLEKLSSKKYQKYIDAKEILDIADDDYEALLGTNGKPGIIDEKIKSLRDQADRAKQIGKDQVAGQKEAQIEKCEYIKKKLRKSGLTREEAVQTRLHAVWSTTKDVTKLANEAAVGQAKVGAGITGSLTLVRNVVACIKGAMENAKSGYLQSLSKTNLATTLVTTTVDVGKTLHRYFGGEITGVQCIEELGQQGVGEIGSAMFSTMGMSAAVSMAPAEAAMESVAAYGMVGGLIGATLGYTAAVVCYQELSTALKEAELAREERIRIEKECAEAIALIRQYRMEMNHMVSEYLTDHIQRFNQGFLEMDKAIAEQDVNGFLRGNASIQELLGKEVQFRTQEEFDALMSSDIALKL